jgi:uncharacterized cupredoxin-like copper-binding protein
MLTLAACGGSGTSSTSAGAGSPASAPSAPSGPSASDDAPVTGTVHVVATDTACTASAATLPSGAIEVTVDNQGTIVTEVYLYAPHDQVIGEVEGVDPGDSGSFDVDVGGGQYELACKPGQEGDGIRTPLHLDGPLDPNQTAVPDPATARGVESFAIEVELTSDEFAEALEELVVVEHQTVTFRVANNAPDVRSFAVLDANGSTVLGTTNDLVPGASADVTITFATEGEFTAVDPIGDHRAQGSTAAFRVIE